MYAAWGQGREGGLYRFVVLVREKKHADAHINAHQRKQTHLYAQRYKCKEREEARTVHIILTALLTWTTQALCSGLRIN